MRNYIIDSVAVFLEKRASRQLVGILKRQNNDLVFLYNDRYFNAKNVIPLGPEFPLTQKEFISKKLFPSLIDRIPSIQNPAYEEYCLAMGINPEEKDPIILLSTIGRKGPSSFIFYPIYQRTINSEDIIKYRKLLGLTTREFAAIFEFSQSSLNSLERKRIEGNEILKRLEILLYDPCVALHYLILNGGYITYEKWAYATNKLKKIHQDVKGENLTNKKGEDI